MAEAQQDVAEEEERPWERPGALRKDYAPHRGPLLSWLGVASVLLVPGGIGAALLHLVGAL